MAGRRSPLSKEEKKSGKFDAGRQGLTTEEKGKVVPLSEHVPSNRAYIKMTKAQFVAEMKRLKEKKLEMQKFSKEYDEKKQKEIDNLGKQGPKVKKADIAQKIQKLTKLPPATEKSLRAKIAKLPDEVDQKSLSALLDSKKDSLKKK